MALGNIILLICIVLILIIFMNAPIESYINQHKGPRKKSVSFNPNVSFYYYPDETS